MYPIQKPNHTIIHIKQFVVLVVHLRDAGKEIISAVHRARIQQLARQKPPIRQDMVGEQQPRQDHRQDVREDVLRDRRVLRGERDGRDEAVVRLVDARVEEREVEQPVHVVERGLADGDRARDAPQEFSGAGERGHDAVLRRLPAQVRGAEQEDVDRGRHGLVAEDDVEALEDVAARRGLGRRLDLVPVGERRGDVVERHVYRAWEPEEGELDEQQAEELDEGERVCCYYRCPKAGEARHDGRNGLGNAGTHITGPSFERLFITLSVEFKYEISQAQFSITWSMSYPTWRFVEVSLLRRGLAFRVQYVKLQNKEIFALPSTVRPQRRRVRVKRRKCWTAKQESASKL
jgi:hypothetical protein